MSFLRRGYKFPKLFKTKQRNSVINSPISCHQILHRNCQNESYFNTNDVNSIVELNKLITNINTSIIEMNNRKRLLDSNIKNCETDINEEFNKLQITLDQRKNELIRMLNNRNTNLQENLTAQIETFNSYKSGIEILTKWASQTNITDETRKYVITQATQEWKYHTKNLDVLIGRLQKLGFECNDDYINALKLFNKYGTLKGCDIIQAPNICLNEINARSVQVGIGVDESDGLGLKGFIEVTHKNDYVKDNYWIEMCSFNIDNETQNEYDIGSLTCDTEYLIRCKLKFKNDVVSYSNVIAFKTRSSDDQLLTKEYEKYLSGLIKKSTSISKIELVYDAKRDGFDIESYFNKCLNIPYPTITIIKSNYGNIFGGYYTIERTKDYQWKDDVNSFLFQLKPDMKQFSKRANDKGSILMWSSDLIRFGVSQLQVYKVIP